MCSRKLKRTSASSVGKASAFFALGKLRTRKSMKSQIRASRPEAVSLARAAQSLVAVLLPERALGRGDGAVQPLVRRDRFAQGPCRALEAAFDDVVAVVGVEILDVQADPGML